jgi:hypothetical protein
MIKVVPNVICFAIFLNGTKLFNNFFFILIKNLLNRIQIVCDHMKYFIKSQHSFVIMFMKLVNGFYNIYC